ncbi:MAG TPA: nucleotide exchange factor GrpE [bacterium]|nr:nucleotide exchange factor GrpE [Myxococcales bacterium]OQA61037.1 MAG: heat shock protein GrpE [bacterium ADurb.Bin270]HPW44925.1 nucleotide exchange factor GrpE [bacterium]HQG12775.1 nucleotide exchange factor GrpE [bacterium]
MTKKQSNNFEKDSVKAAGKKNPRGMADGQPSDQATSEDDVTREIESAEHEAQLHHDKLLRVMAEFENFKKRMQREKEGIVKYGNEKLLESLLPSLDDLDRVLDHVSPDASEEAKNIADGVELVRKSLLTALEKHELKEIPALGEKFDPTVHEAISVVDDDDLEPGTIVSVHRKGYWLADRLLRPVMVSVVKGE